jgi:GH15 family glucan-1,4-alpha-glucosidase
MAAPIEDYALLSNLSTGSLVARGGSVDWLCFPRFDSEAIHAALLGTEDNGRWLLAPALPDALVLERRYVPSTFVLETTWQVSTGQVLVSDFMPVGEDRSSLVRRVTGLRGTVTMLQDLRIRPRYGLVTPWVTRSRESGALGHADVLLAMAGPDAWALRSDCLPQAQEQGHRGEFTVSEGQSVDFELTWFPSHREAPPALDVGLALAEAVRYWTAWGDNCRQDGI